MNNSALDLALKEENLEITKLLVKLLINNNIEINDKNIVKLFNFAVNVLDLEITKLLIEKYNFHKKYENNFNLSLFKLVDRNASIILKLMTDNGANPNIQNQNGDTPLHFAIKIVDRKSKWNKWELLNDLLEYGANVNITNNDGKTPIDICKDQNLINLLLTNKNRKRKWNEINSINCHNHSSTSGYKPKSSHHKSKKR